MVLMLPASSGLIIRAADGTVEHFPARVAIHVVLVPGPDGWECVRMVGQN